MAPGAAQQRLRGTMNDQAQPLIAVILWTFLSVAVIAQGPPPAQHRTVTQSGGIKQFVPSTNSPPMANQVQIAVEGAWRVLRSNGVPDHKTGAFPNRNNPHTIQAQNYVFRVPAKPEIASRITPLGLQRFGFAVNGVPFEPALAEWYLGQRESPWQYEALSGAIPLGIDASFADVHANGAYHYHGLPVELLDRLRITRGQHSPLIGWAADGFPIYAGNGYEQPKNSQSRVVRLDSSYRLKRGFRPSGAGAPGGNFDGTFIADYEFVEGHGSLDECNGRFCVTPEFPEGTYAYFLTLDWPVVPRYFRGTPAHK